MQKADFRFPDTQRTGSNGCLKWLLVGVSIITSSALASGQNQESLADQGFAANLLPEVQHTHKVARSVCPARGAPTGYGSLQHTGRRQNSGAAQREHGQLHWHLPREVRLKRANQALLKQEEGVFYKKPSFDEEPRQLAREP